MNIGSERGGQVLTGDIWKNRYGPELGPDQRVQRGGHFWKMSEKGPDLWIIKMD